MMMMMIIVIMIMIMMILSLTRGRSVTKVTEGITRGMSKLTFDSEYQNQMASREKAQNVRSFVAAAAAAAAAAVCALHLTWRVCV